MLEIIKESRNGLVIPAETTLEQWLAIGKAFNRADDLLCWCIGDWIAFGQKHVGWGDKFTEAIEATGIEYGSLREYASVSERVAIVVRTTNLSWSHHRAVAALDDDNQRHWLEVATKHDLSVAELKASIQAGKVIRAAQLEAERDARKGLSGPHAILSVFNRAVRDVISRVPIDRWSVATRAAWKEQLKPVADFYAKL